MNENVEPALRKVESYIQGFFWLLPNLAIALLVFAVLRTAFPKRRAEYDVGVGYGDDLDKACRLIQEALRGIEGVEAKPAPEAFPWVLDDSSVNIKVRWWSDSQKANVVLTRGRVIGTVKRTLAAAGVDLPFPTQVVLFHDQTEETDGIRDRQREGWPPGNNMPRPLRPRGLGWSGSGNGHPQEAQGSQAEDNRADRSAMHQPSGEPSSAFGKRRAGQS